MPVASLPVLVVVGLVICIAAVPLWYPRYSLFNRNGSAAIVRLRRELAADTTTDESDGLSGVATLESGEAGFSALVETIRANSHVDGTPVRIELTHTDPDPEFEMVVIGGEDATEEQAVLRVTYEDGTSEAVLESASLGVDRVLELVDLRRWLTARVHTRSQYATTVLVVCWATAMIVGLR